MKLDIVIFVVLVALSVLPITWFLRNGEKISGSENVEDVRIAEEDGGGEAVREVPLTTATRSTTSASRVDSSAMSSASSKKLAVFVGFEDARYQKHDVLIRKLVAEYNRDRRKWAGATQAQARNMPLLDASQVKAQMIQETGGRDVASRTAWNIDPLQVNVPGDWTPHKKYLGLRKPRRRNEGTAERNIRAAIMHLSRKGFGTSAQLAANAPDSKFDGWHQALSRYNGRSEMTDEGVRYRDAYANRIMRRTKTGRRKLVPISIRVRKK